MGLQAGAHGLAACTTTCGCSLCHVWLQLASASAIACDLGPALLSTGMLGPPCPIRLRCCSCLAPSLLAAACDSRDSAFLSRAASLAEAGVGLAAAGGEAEEAVEAEEAAKAVAVAVAAVAAS